MTVAEAKSLKKSDKIITSVNGKLTHGSVQKVIQKSRSEFKVLFISNNGREITRSYKGMDVVK